MVDSGRTQIFLDEIVNVTDSSKIVLEAGIGTGLLSFIAATKAKKVYGLEINPEIFKLANEIKNHLVSKGMIDQEKIEFLLADATQYVPPENPDIIISENIYTGMLEEQQVEIMRNLGRFLKPNGIIIPTKLSSFFSINETTFPTTPQNQEIFVPTELKTKIATKLLSNEIMYDELNFHQIESSAVQYDDAITVCESGEFNSLVFYSVVEMPSGRKINRYDSTFMSNDIIRALQPLLRVQKDSKINLKLCYPYGCKTPDIVIKINENE